MMYKYDEFLNRYAIKHCIVKRPPRQFDYHNQPNKFYAPDCEEIVELEMYSRSFEYLVTVDDEHTKMYQDKRDEAWMRKQYPAIKEAYDKYLMLLALYK